MEGQIGPLGISLIIFGVIFLVIFLLFLMIKCPFCKKKERRVPFSGHKPAK